MRLLACFSLFASAVLASTVFAQGAAPLAAVSLDRDSSERFGAALGPARLEAQAVAAGVLQVVTRADELDKKRRGRFFPMTPVLRQLARGATGHPALLLLEPLVFPDRFAKPQSPNAQIALRAGLIEASGDFKDALAGPVYRSILANGAEFYELRAATEGMGKLGLEADVAWLAKLAVSAGPKQDAVIAGLGSCRQLAAARALATIAQSKPTEARAKRVAQSLGTMGSAWALETLDLPAADAAALRTHTARAAISLYLAASEGEVRDAASDAVMAIDAPETPGLVAAEMGKATPDGQSALAALRTRFDRNPTRMTR
jgi:hypothetical protein